MLRSAAGTFAKFAAESTVDSKKRPPESESQAKAKMTMERAKRELGQRRPTIGRLMAARDQGRPFFGAQPAQAQGPVPSAVPTALSGAMPAQSLAPVGAPPRSAPPARSQGPTPAIGNFQLPAAALRSASQFGLGASRPAAQSVPAQAPQAPIDLRAILGSPAAQASPAGARTPPGAQALAGSPKASPLPQAPQAPAGQQFSIQDLLSYLRPGAEAIGQGLGTAGGFLVDLPRALAWQGATSANQPDAARYLLGADQSIPGISAADKLRHREAFVKRHMADFNAQQLREKQERAGVAPGMPSYKTRQGLEARYDQPLPDVTPTSGPYVPLEQQTQAVFPEGMTYAQEQDWLNRWRAARRGGPLGSKSMADISRVTDSPYVRLEQRARSSGVPKDLRPEEVADWIRYTNESRAKTGSPNSTLLAPAGHFAKTAGLADVTKRLRAWVHTPTATDLLERLQSSGAPSRGLASELAQLSSMGGRQVSSGAAHGELQNQYRQMVKALGNEASMTDYVRRGLRKVVGE